MSHRKSPCSSQAPTIERGLDRRQEHLYRLELAKDECVQRDRRTARHRRHRRRPAVRTAASSRIFKSEIRRQGRGAGRRRRRDARHVRLAITPGARHRRRLVRDPAWLTVTPPPMRIARCRRRRRCARRPFDSNPWPNSPTRGRYSSGRSPSPRQVRGPDDALVGILVFELAGNALEARDDARAGVALSARDCDSRTRMGRRAPVPRHGAISTGRVASSVPVRARRRKRCFGRRPR